MALVTTVVWVRSLAWELPHAVGVAKKKKLINKDEGQIENWGIEPQQEQQRVGLIPIHYTNSQIDKEIEK